jgi:hypothetical protein
MFMVPYIKFRQDVKYFNDFLWDEMELDTLVHSQPSKADEYFKQRSKISITTIDCYMYISSC